MQVAAWTYKARNTTMEAHSATLPKGTRYVIKLNAEVARRNVHAPIRYVPTISKRLVSSGYTSG